MGVNSTQGFKYKLVAYPDYDTTNSIILDLFKDEEIKLSNNITGLFDLGILPSDFTRTITLPGSKKNNNFFEFVYDISVEDPYTFATNQKVPCYLDFDGIYLSNGYIQLNKVNIYQNKFIDSYEVTIYGGLASFGRDLKTYFLSNLTSLNQFNHTASLSNITSSWDGNLFSGSIVYPMIDYGQRLRYTPTDVNSGIDSETGAMCVQDFKPAIRVKEVWDAIFTEFGYTYTSDFFNESWWDDVYMICNKTLRYPIFPSASNEVIINGTSSVDLETYGNFTFGPVSGSSAISQSMPPGATYPLNWYNITRNPSGILSSSLEFDLDMDSNLRGEINLNFVIAPSGSFVIGYGYGVPNFNLIIQGYISAGWTTISTIPLTNINDYMEQVNTYNSGSTKTEQFNLVQEWNQVYDGGIFTNGSPKDTQLRFALEVNTLDFGIDNFTLRMDPGGAKSYLSVNKVNQAGEGLIMDIPSNMPIGSSGQNNGENNGVLLIDFITAIQKKFNLVIYPNKEKLWDFIVEPFNTWYKAGSIKDFNRYINLNDKIEATPANNLAVNKLNFGDTLDTDYISQQFAKEANREYGKSYYVDFENYFSQGEYTVKSSFASSPLIYLDGTGLSGSQTSTNINCPTCNSVTLSNCYQINYGGGGPVSSSVAYYTNCDGSSSAQWMGGTVINAWICSRVNPTLGGSQISWTLLEPCAPTAVTSSANKMYIPTFISSITYAPTTTLPHIYFYNGLLDSQPWYIESQKFAAIGATEFNSFPYFDNYNTFVSNSAPTANNLSLLFNNEQSVYGTTPTESLYSEYWSTYIDLLYNPRTRLFDCSAIIPLADYFKLNLNDIVEWRGNYYHLRAINDYNLSNGECKLQLLGPVIRDVIANVLPEFSCDFNFDIGTYTPAESASFIVAQCFGASQLQVGFTSSLSMSIGESFTFPAEYALDDCWYVSSSFSGALDLSDVSISQSFVDCSECSASLHPEPPPPPPECEATQWKIDNSASSFGSFYGGLDCDDNNVGGYVDAYNIGFTSCIKDGTLTTTGFPVVTVDAIC